MAKKKGKEVQQSSFLRLRQVRRALEKVWIVVAYQYGVSLESSQETVTSNSLLMNYITFEHSQLLFSRLPKQVCVTQRSNYEQLCPPQSFKGRRVAAIQAEGLANFVKKYMIENICTKPNQKNSRSHLASLGWGVRPKSAK